MVAKRAGWGAVNAVLNQSCPQAFGSWARFAAGVLAGPALARRCPRETEDVVVAAGLQHHCVLLTAAARHADAALAIELAVLTHVRKAHEEVPCSLVLLDCHTAAIALDVAADRAALRGRIRAVCPVALALGGEHAATPIQLSAHSEVVAILVLLSEVLDRDAE